MTQFSFDTSGFVSGPPQGVRTKRFYWSDLSPFEQGYVEALARDYSDRLTTGLGEPLDVGFSDLAPEALEMIRKDCAAMGPAEPRAYNADGVNRMGQRFWRERQAGEYRAFPPLRITLGDDGKVYLTAA